MVDPIREHFDGIARYYDGYKKRNSFYYRNLRKLLSRLIPRNKIVLEIGCGTGDLLASVNPRRGYGIDISTQMINLARGKYSHNKKLNFSTKSIGEFKNRHLDFVFMSDVIEHIPEPARVFRQIKYILKPKTVFIVTMANPIWEPILNIAEKLGLKMPEGDHHRWEYKKLKFELEKLGIDVLQHNYALLFPIKLPLNTNFVNRYLESILRPLSFIEYFSAHLVIKRPPTSTRKK